MSTETTFEFDKLNRVPRKFIKAAIQEYQEKNPNKALNRYELCRIISFKMEAKYLRPQDSDSINDDFESCDDDLNSDELDVEVNTKNSNNKKNYNGEHILKKMKLQSTGPILEKIDYYIYRYY